ncbi:signal peptide peptidase SppA [Roseiterribacter gracilis]|uniref:Protease n=1 Tax=Roseiterribacter gracilis TaxID=2812848 RepID=A0A8S8XHE3_9PROT|nr:protease [Rhodospirillales bacterium TMPK1]
MRYLVGFFAAIGVLFVLAIAFSVWVVSNVRTLQPAPQPIPAVAVLAIDLKSAIAEETGGVELPLPFLENKARLRDIVGTITRAANDGRVKVLMLRMEGGAAGLAQAQEISDALQRFRDKNKTVIAWADTLGEGGPANSSYLLTAMATQSWVQPQGQVGLMGYGSDFLFYRNALERIGVKYEVWKRKEYKSALDEYVETQIPAPVRENYESLFGDVMKQLIERAAAARKLDQAVLRAAIEKGPLLASEALDAKLIDKIGYRDEAEAAALAEAGAGAKIVEFPAYRAALQQVVPPANATQIAVIYGVGEINRRSARDFSNTDPVMTPEPLRKAFEEAISNAAIKAIVFRVDSPGGSPVASETIRRDVLRAKAAGKKVIVSMGNVAASGGYWIAMDADKIVAQPGTITGSIGVIGGKPEASGLAKLLNIGIDKITTTDQPPLSIWRRLTEQQRQRQEVHLDDTYGAFVQNVAAGRKLAPEKVEAVAKGRVWTGRQAKEIGLVDELGGIDVAFKVVRTELGLAADAPLATRVLPARRTPGEQILRMLRGEDSVSVFEPLGPFLRAYRELTASEGTRTLLYTGPSVD